MNTVNVSDIENMPPEKREHLQNVRELSQKLIDACNTVGRSQAGILDALMTAYLHVAEVYGRSTQCAEHMVEIGGGILIKHAMQQQAAGIDPMTPPTTH